MTQTLAEEENTADAAGENGIMPTKIPKKMSKNTQSKKKVTLLTKIQPRRSSTQPSPRAMKKTGLTRMFGQHLTRNPRHHLWYRRWTTRAFIVTTTYRELGQAVPSATIYGDYHITENLDRLCGMLDWSSLTSHPHTRAGVHTHEYHPKCGITIHRRAPKAE